MWTFLKSLKMHNKYMYWYNVNPSIWKDRICYDQGDPDIWYNQGDPDICIYKNLWFIFLCKWHKTDKRTMWQYRNQFPMNNWVLKTVTWPRKLKLQQSINSSKTVSKIRNNGPFKIH